eukprot:GHVO01055904.1.p1 GENE.GHVO01055904.1~~GHVO01055904.1.p1  ORF type:complete len:118 (+),score=10.89 GHVO01055904.1:108-461(+)
MKLITPNEGACTRVWRYQLNSTVAIYNINHSIYAKQLQMSTSTPCDVHQLSRMSFFMFCLGVEASMESTPRTLESVLTFLATFEWLTESNKRRQQLDIKIFSEDKQLSQKEENRINN